MTDQTETQVRELAEDIVRSVVGEPPTAEIGGAGLTRTVERVTALLRASALARQAAGATWTEVTDDPATWPDDEMPGPVLTECAGRLGLFRHVNDEAHDARRLCAPGAIGRVLRWMPWPAAAQGASA